MKRVSCKTCGEKMLAKEILTHYWTKHREEFQSRMRRGRRQSQPRAGAIEITVPGYRVTFTPQGKGR